MNRTLLVRGTAGVSALTVERIEPGVPVDVAYACRVLVGSVDRPILGTAVVVRGTAVGEPDAFVVFARSVTNRDCWVMLTGELDKGQVGEWQSHRGSLAFPSPEVAGWLSAVVPDERGAG